MKILEQRALDVLSGKKPELLWIIEHTEFIQLEQAQSLRFVR